MSKIKSFQSYYKIWIIYFIESPKKFMCAENLAQKLKNDLRDNNVTHLNFHYFQFILKLLVISQKQIYGNLALGET